VREPADLNELVGDELSPDQLGQLREVDALLRRVPAPPHDVPARLTAAVAEVPLAARRERRGRQVALALAFAAMLAAASFGIGHWAGSRFEAAYTVDMAPTASARDAAAIVQVGERDEGSGNVELLVDVSGLPELGPDDYYALWLEQDGEWAATCGYFAVGEGETSVRMTVSYDFRDFDAWIISATDRDDPEPLLTAEIPDA
jgi:Anti-sigma-K factor rskA